MHGGGAKEAKELKVRCSWVVARGTEASATTSSFKLNREREQISRSPASISVERLIIDRMIRCL